MRVIYKRTRLDKKFDDIDGSINSVGQPIFVPRKDDVVILENAFWGVACVEYDMDQDHILIWLEQLRLKGGMYVPYSVEEERKMLHADAAKARAEHALRQKPDVQPE